MSNEPTTARLVIREIPSRRVTLLAFIVALNVLVIAGLRGTAIALDRIGLFRSFCTSPLPCPVCGFVPPWQWTANEWRATVFPWR